jgi:bifunctional lysine-specific demethylase and histidyl-hydroxylase NO66
LTTGDAWTARRVHHPDAPRLEALTADPAAFVAENLFRHMVCSPASERIGPLLTTPEALWADVLGRGARTPTFRLVRDGATLPASTYCRSAGIGNRTIDDVIQPNRVLELHDAGATMVVQGLQLTDPHLARLAVNLALDLDQAVQVNAYLTPAAAKGLELHFDYHDVFVIQLDGAKRWRVWEPLPRTRLPVKAARVPMPTFDELGPPALDRTLEAGDVVYLPRGFPHAAETVDAASAHLTIGVLAATWHQAVRHAVDAAVAGGALRESIRPGEALGGGLEELGARLSPAVVRRWTTIQMWRRMPATRLRPLHAPVIDGATEVALTPGPLLWTAIEDGHAELGLGDRVLRMPAEAHPLLCAVLGTDGPFDLAGLAVALDKESRVVVGRRLAAEGVIAPAC